MFWLGISRPGTDDGGGDGRNVDVSSRARAPVFFENHRPAMIASMDLCPLRQNIDILMDAFDFLNVVLPPHHDRLAQKNK